MGLWLESIKLLEDRQTQTSKEVILEEIGQQLISLPQHKQEEVSPKGPSLGDEQHQLSNGRSKQFIEAEKGQTIGEIKIAITIIVIETTHCRLITKTSLTTIEVTLVEAETKIGADEKIARVEVAHVGYASVIVAQACLAIWNLAHIALTPVAAENSPDLLVALLSR